LLLDSIPGTKFVSKKLQNERLDICGDCEELDREKEKCTLCNCFIDQKTGVKTLPFIGKVECPLKKW